LSASTSGAIIASTAASKSASRGRIEATLSCPPQAGQTHSGRSVGLGEDHVGEHGEVQPRSVLREQGISHPRQPHLLYPPLSSVAGSECCLLQFPSERNPVPEVGGVPFSRGTSGISLLGSEPSISGSVSPPFPPNKEVMGQPSGWVYPTTVVAGRGLDASYTQSSAKGDRGGAYVLADSLPRGRLPLPVTVNRGDESPWARLPVVDAPVQGGREVLVSHDLRPEVATSGVVRNMRPSTSGSASASGFVPEVKSGRPGVHSGAGAEIHPSLEVLVNMQNQIDMLTSHLLGSVSCALPSPRPRQLGRPVPTATSISEQFTCSQEVDQQQLPAAVVQTEQQEVEDEEDDLQRNEDASALPVNPSVAGDLMSALTTVAQHFPHLVHQVAPTQLPGCGSRAYLSAGGSQAGQLRFAETPLMSSWMNFHLNTLRGLRDRGAAPWSDADSVFDLQSPLPPGSRVASRKLFSAGKPILVDPALPEVPPRLSSQQATLLGTPPPTRTKNIKDYEAAVVYANEIELSNAGQGLQVADSLVQALSSSLRESDNQNMVREDLDPTLVLDLLDAIPAALTHAAGAVAAALVNSRVARRDATLASSKTLVDDLRARLRATPFAGAALFGPELQEALDRTQRAQEPKSAGAFVQALTQALAKQPAPAPSAAKNVRVRYRQRKKPTQTTSQSTSGNSNPPRGRGVGRGRGRGGRGRGRGQFSRYQEN
jgi:hypothetical protein